MNGFHGKLDVTLIMTSVLVVLSSLLAQFYEVPALARYIRIVAFSYAIAPVAHPIYALLSRDMAFDKLAMLDTVTTLVNALASVSLILLGFSYIGLGLGIGHVCGYVDTTRPLCTT